MALTDAQRAKVLEVVNQKISPMQPCALCRQVRWTVQSGLVALVIQDDLQAMQLTGNVLPAVVLICNNCGNMHLLNILILGLGDSLGIKPVSVTVQETGNA